MPGDAGQGYCYEGYTGPLCQLCIPLDNGTSSNASKRYFNEIRAECTDCPDVQSRVRNIAIVGVGFVAVVGGFVRILSFFPAYWLGFITRARRGWMKVGDHAIMAKFKILLALYQTITAIPTVYGVTLSDWYDKVMEPASWLEIRWDSFVVPGACLPGGFNARLWLRGTFPFAVIAIIIFGRLALPLLIGVAHSAIHRVVSSESIASPTLKKLGTSALLYIESTRDEQSGRSCFRRIMASMPLVLFVLFCFCPTVSTGIFSAFDCVQFEIDATTSRGFLRNDLSVECDLSDPDYVKILPTAYFLVILWPVCVPALFVLVLLPARRRLMEKRNTRLVRATAFIHKEYEPRVPCTSTHRLGCHVACSLGAATQHTHGPIPCLGSSSFGKRSTFSSGSL